METLIKVKEDFYKFKDYIIYSIKSELKVQFSSTFLGYVWWILDPLMYMLIYVLVVKVIFNRGGDDFAVFVFSALVPWKWTISSITESTNSISAKYSLIQQVYIPKYIFPLIKNLVNTFKFLVGIGILMLFIIFSAKITIFIPLFILVAFVNLFFSLAISMILSHFGVYFKDINNILSFVSRLWFYLSPALYPLESIPDSIRFLWWLNPMTTFYISYRNVFVYGKNPLYIELLIWFVISIAVLLIGIRQINKFDRNYTKVV